MDTLGIRHPRRVFWIVFSTLVLLIAGLIIYFEASERVKVLLSLRDTTDRPVANTRVTVERVRRPSIGTVDTGSEQRLTSLSQTYTDESGTITFSIVREEQTLRITIATEHSEELRISGDQAAQDVLNLRLVVPVEVLRELSR